MLSTLRKITPIGFMILFAFIAVPANAQQVYPQQPILLEPENGTSIAFPGSNNPVTFRWSAVLGASQYEINVRVGNIPRSPVETSSTSAEIDLNLPVTNQNTAVFWSVRAGDDDGYSTQQVQTASFIITPSGNVTPTVQPTPSATPTPILLPLTKPELLSPANHETVSINTAISGINFDWNDVAGADKFILRIYQTNEVYKQIETGVSEQQRVRVQPVIADVFQWDVEAVQNRNGKSLFSERFSFSVGAGVLPSPTPVPYSADINRDQQINARDVFLFASLFLTNAPNGDLNNTGVEDQLDVLQFLELFAANQ